MKKFLSSIITALISLFTPLYEAAERKFTLGVIGDLPSNGASRTSGAPRDININVTTDPKFINRSNEPIIDVVSSADFIPDSYQQKIVSDTGTGAASITAYAFNEDVFNATPTDNGSGAASVSNTYNDGWTGTGYNNQIKIANSGRGVLMYGITMIYQLTDGLVQDPAGLGGSNLNLLSATLVGNTMKPSPAPLNQGFNYGQYQTGIMTVLKKFYVSAIGQLSYVVPVGDTVTMITLNKPQAGQ